MPFLNGFGTVKLQSLGIICQQTRISAETEGDAQIGDSFFVRHNVNDRIGGHSAELITVSVGQSDDIAGKLYNSKLHTQTESQVRNFLFSGVADSTDHTFDTPVTKAAGNDDSIHIGKKFVDIIITDQLGIDPFDLHFRIIGNGAMLQCFHHTDIGIMKGHIFANQSNFYFMFWILPGLNHLNPVAKIRLRTIHIQAVAHNICQLFFFHGKRQLIKNIHIKILDDSLLRDITELRNLFFDAVVQRKVGTTYQDIRLNTHTLQFFDTGLCRFGFKLSGSFQIWDQRHMDENTVLMSHIMLELAERLQERLTLNIAHGSANLDNSYLYL